MQVVYIKLEDLVPYENNPRVNEESVEYVANSIKEFGFKVPMVIDKNNVIITGHTRYEACKVLGINEVPCIVADNLTDEQIKKFRLIDNKSMELAMWDYEKLEKELESLDFDMEKFGFLDNNQNYDFIDSMLGSGFAGEKSEFELFSLKIELPISDREFIEAKIKEVGKEQIINQVLERMS